MTFVPADSHHPGVGQSNRLYEDLRNLSGCPTAIRLWLEHPVKRLQFDCHTLSHLNRPVALTERAALTCYTKRMARGWESKAVEAQIEIAETRLGSNKAQRTPVELEKSRLRESLLMSRHRVLQDLQQSTNPRYRKMLNDALAHLEAKLAQLD